MKEDIADKIRILRLTQNLSQQNMADELQITVAAYSNIERGVTDISVSRLQQIADILKTEITTFFQSDFQVNESHQVYESVLALQVQQLMNLYQKQQIQLDRLTQELALLKKKFV